MDKEKKDKLLDIINKSNNILLITSTRPNLDSISAVFLFWHFLHLNFKKKVDVAIQNYPERFDYLFDYSMISKDAILKWFAREYKISIKRQDTVIDKVRYDLDNEYFNFYISLERGNLDLKNINFDKSKIIYDLVVTLDVPNLNFLGNFFKVYKDEIDNSIKIINVDSHSNNLKFGDLNILSSEVSSTSELVFEILESFNTLTSQKEYQLVLMSILSNTDNLTSQSISPKTFENISKLQSKGGNMKKSILEINSILKFEDLKIKGKILSSVTSTEYKGRKYIYSLIKSSDINIFPSYLTDMYIKGCSATCIGVISDEKFIKVYIKDFKDYINKEKLSKFFDNVNFENGIYSFTSNDKDILNIFEKISI